DATGLLALQFATAAVVQGRIPSFSGGLQMFAWLTVGGIGLGLLIGFIAYYIEMRIDDAPIEIILSLLIPYGAYFAAEEIHASGVLAVVACGLFLSRRSANFFSPSVRIQITAVWQSLNFVLNGLVFVLIGLQLPAIKAGISDYSLRALLVNGAIFSVLLIALRLIWIYPSAAVALFIRTRFLHQNERPQPLRNIFVAGWTGMRGV